MLYWDSAWSQSPTVSIAETPTGVFLNSTIKQEAAPFSVKKGGKMCIAVLTLTERIVSQCRWEELDLF